MKNQCLGRLFRGATITLAAVGMLFAATSVRAACGDPSAMGLGIFPKLPAVLQPAENGLSDAASSKDSKSVTSGTYDSIVGMRHVTYSSGGQELNQAFSQWHSDGTEWESADLPTITGNICLGVWKQIGQNTIRKHHTGWTFDSTGIVSGTMVLDEKDSLGPNGLTYEGTFDLKFYDLNGMLLQEVKGTSTATRITVD